MKFLKLNQQREAEFRSWARTFYVPFTDIQGVWHPCVQDECVKINVEHTTYVNGDEQNDR